MARDYSKTRKWWKKAAAAGDVKAQNNLGSLYENGLGVEQDYAKAREFYEKAATTGYKNEGSQGNINLPPDATKSLFESVENGTPVLCFRTDNTDDIVKTQPDQSESVAVAQADEQPTETVPETTPPLD